MKHVILNKAAKKYINTQRNVLITIYMIFGLVVDVGYYYVGFIMSMHKFCTFYMAQIIIHYIMIINLQNFFLKLFEN